MILWINQILSSFPLYSTQSPSKSTRVCHSSLSNSTVSLSHRPKRRCDLYDLHNELIPYAEAWSWQNAIVKEKKAASQNSEDIADTLIILQHHPVYTLGAGSSEEYLNFDVKDAPFDLYRTERGGEVTYHGPGQLVMYPIINLRHYKMDLHWYLRALEEVVIRALSSAFAIEASRVEGLTGVWVGNKKLAAIGIKVSQWITYHGMALNVTTDITPFHLIVPCEIQDRQVGTIKDLLNENSQYKVGGQDNHDTTNDFELIDITHKSLITEFCEVFQVDLGINLYKDEVIFSVPNSTQKIIMQSPYSMILARHHLLQSIDIRDFLFAGNNSGFEYPNPYQMNSYRTNVSGPGSVSCHSYLDCHSRFVLEIRHSR